MKIKGGYYIKARKIQESEISVAPPYVREIWDWLLKEANHKEKRYGKYTIKRGQLFRTYKDIREGLAWYIGYRKEMYHENHTKKAMKFLREHHMIGTMKALGGVMITICNYDLYQNPKNYERTTGGTIEETNEEPMENQGIPDNNKNVKKEKNDKEKDIIAKQVNELFAYYELKISSIRAKTEKRKGMVKARLKTYSIDELKKAIDFISNSEWHNGNNNKGKKYNSLELIFRNDEQVEKYIKMKNCNPKQSDLQKALEEITEEEVKNGQ